jgi:hypothetical protein
MAAFTHVRVVHLNAAGQIVFEPERRVMDPQVFLKGLEQEGGPFPSSSVEPDRYLLDLLNDDGDIVSDRNLAAPHVDALRARGFFGVGSHEEE